MRMPVTLLAGVFMLTAAAAQTVQLSGQPPACTATPPAQAVAAGYTKLVVCNSLLNNVPIDVNNTANPWFFSYPTGFGYTVPSSDISNTGTGVTIATIPASPTDGGLFSIIVKPTSYGGNTVTGGLYLEGDMKFNASTCDASPNNPPALWMNAPKGVVGSPDGEFTEIDLMEWINCVAKTTIHDWTITGGSYTENCQNSNNTTALSPGSGFNTYGILLIPAGAGTGTVEWFFNNTLTTTVTYSAAGKPNPAGSCPNGAFATADSQPWTWVLKAGTSNPTTFRNIHIWQAP